MYEKDKVRYEKEMKLYAKEKPPAKEPTKLLKMKKQKSRKTNSMTKVIEHARSSPDLASPVQTSLTMENNPCSLVTQSSTSQFNLLNNLPSFTNLPSSMLDIGGDSEDESFNSFGYDTV